MNDNMYVLLTYGTLMKGMCRNEMLYSFGCRYVADLTLSHTKLYHFPTGNYPVLLGSEDDNDTSVCEAWAIPNNKEVLEALIQTLDYIEGEGTLYNRCEIEVGEGVTGIIYIGNQHYWLDNNIPLVEATTDNSGKWHPIY